MAYGATYHGESDADDEYDRSELASPRRAEDSEASAIEDSEPPSTELTPTSFANVGNTRTATKKLINEWTTEECADFLAGLGLKQYRDAFTENEITGEALVAVKHEELKEMGISSAGHRLTILKSVYETKVKQGIPLDPDHYVSLSADRGDQDDPVTHDDIAHLLRSIRLRDERLMATEAELRRLADDYRKLREELLPVFKLAKDKSQPLPYQPNLPSYSGSTLSPEHQHDQPATSPSTSTLGYFSSQPDKSGGSISRSFSKKLFAGGTTPKNNSPTQLPQSIPEGRPFNDTSTLDPSAAAVAASSHLTASMNGGQPSPKGAPSPTSPGSFYAPQTLGPRSYSREITSNNFSRSGYDHPEDGPSSQLRQDRPGVGPSSGGRQDQSSGPSSGGGGPGGGGGGGGGGSSRNTADPGGPSVEIFKSFRVSMDDPCHKVLPAALKKYNINEDWQRYALYIVYGDQERCLGLDERPLILFKQLDKEGKKPMFMLRKQTPAADGQPTNIYPGAGPGSGGSISGGVMGPPSINTNLDGSTGMGPQPGGGSAGGPRNPPPQMGTIQLPGGVL